MKLLLNQIISESLEAVKADKLLQNVLEKDKLAGNFKLLALGKAACAMAEAAHNYFSKCIKQGLVITKSGYERPVHNYRIMKSSHPFPDESSLAAGKSIFKMVSELKKDDQMLFLVSGGGSSLAILPRNQINIKELIDIYTKLSEAGADIIEINTVRKHLSQLKGGQLAKLAAPAKIFSYLLSDVEGNRIDTIASGYTSPDKTTSQAALSILDEYGIKVSSICRKAIKNETPKSLFNVQFNKVIGDNELFCHVAAKIIMKKGYTPWLITTEMSGEARRYAEFVPEIIKRARNSKGRINLPCIAICGGETTVTVTGNGFGGRNQEMALAAAIKIQNIPGVTVACIASDGMDGKSENAGAIVDNRSYTRMLSAGVNPKASLHNNDSASALAKIDAVIRTWQTDTNLNDVMLIYIE